MTHILQLAEKNVSLSPWWRGAAIYQIYPRSFVDSNCDGVGDIPGITSRLDYVARLGVDAIWLSPFFKSPMKDFGYDVSDYCCVDPIFGTLEDFDAMIARAHALGLKVLIDQVYAHTSDAHAWFTESRTNRTNTKSDWYVWSNPKPDGSPPSNWQSVFGGPAWTWDARRGQYYMHNFLNSQPQLNCHNLQVQDALLSVAQFWLDRGVDGFRLDAINYAMHDPELKDNPPAIDDGTARTRPFDFQIKIHNQSHPNIPQFIERIRALADRYEACFTVAEVGGDHAAREMKAYTLGRTRFNSTYGFDFLFAEQLTPAVVQKALEEWTDEPGIGWPSWAFSNHDAPRWISRWADEANKDAFARMTMLLFVSLRGNIILWQGEELGLPQVDISFEQLKDPEAIANWPLTLSRDGARTPMPWIADAIHCGFTTGSPWLPFGPDHAALAVDQQEGDDHSLLTFTKQLVSFRRANDALLTGSFRIIEASNSLLVFERVSSDQHLVCAFNFGTEPLEWQPTQPDCWRLIKSIGNSRLGALLPLAGLIAQRSESEE